MLRYITVLLLANILQYLSSYTSTGYQDVKVTSTKQRAGEAASQVSFSPLEVICEINGVNVPAIIDTGAQISIMSLCCAKRCRIAGHIDTQHAGKAFGIGSGDIVGRINKASIRMGPVTFDSQLSIIRESRVDILIGLDFLRRFKCEICLVDNIMRFQVRDKHIRIPFTSQTFRYRSTETSELVTVENEEMEMAVDAIRRRGVAPRRRPGPFDGDTEETRDGQDHLDQILDDQSRSNSRQYQSTKHQLLHKTIKNSNQFLHPQTSGGQYESSVGRNVVEEVDEHNISAEEEAEEQDFVSMEGI